MKKKLSYAQKAALREFTRNEWDKPSVTVRGSTLRSLVKRGLLELRCPHGITGVAVGLLWATDMEYRRTKVPEHGEEEEFCSNSRRWMFKRGFQIINNCPGNIFGSETSCPENCSYLEIRKMPPSVRQLFLAMTGKEQDDG